jgi:hypothetical protein
MEIKITLTTNEKELAEKILTEIKNNLIARPLFNDYEITEINLTFSSYDLFTLNDILFKLKNQ